jgi:hypothetical protein
MRFYKLTLTKSETGVILYPETVDLNKITRKYYKHDYTEISFEYPEAIDDASFTEINEAEFDNAIFKYTPIEYIKAARIQSLKTACTAAFYEGFTSSLTDSQGEAHVFGYEAHDQVNFTKQTNDILLTQSRLAEGKITAAEYAAETVIRWKTKNHGVITLTEDEFYHLTRDIKKHEAAVQGKYWLLEARVLAAKTNAEAEAITW